MRVLIPAGFSAGALAAWAIVRHGPPWLAIDRSQPLVVVTYWERPGAFVAAALFAAITLAAIGYLRTLREPPPLARTMAWSALACACALCFPVVFSSDVYAYAGYGDLAYHGISPYAHAAITLRDPLLDAMRWQWGNPPPGCVYGAAFVSIAEGLVALLLHFGPVLVLWGFRILACCTLVLCAPLAYAAFGSFPQRRRLLAAAGIALNPAAIWIAAEGHNDALALAFLLGGCALARRSRIAGIVTALGALAIKGPALAALHVRGHAQYLPQFSLQYVISTFAPVWVGAVLTLAIAAAIVTLGRRQILIALGAAIWLALPNPYPWYALWFLPLAFLADDRRVTSAIVAASLLAALRYYGEATADPGPLVTDLIVALQIGVPAALLFLAGRERAHYGRPDIRTPVPDFALSRLR